MVQHRERRCDWGCGHARLLNLLPGDEALVPATEWDDGSKYVGWCVHKDASRRPLVIDNQPHSGRRVLEGHQVVFGAACSLAVARSGQLALFI